MLVFVKRQKLTDRLLLLHDLARSESRTLPYVLQVRYTRCVHLNDLLHRLRLRRRLCCYGLGGLRLGLHCDLRRWNNSSSSSSSCRNLQL